MKKILAKVLQALWGRASGWRSHWSPSHREWFTSCTAWVFFFMASAALPGVMGPELLQLLPSLHWLTRAVHPSSAWVTRSQLLHTGTKEHRGESSPRQGLPWIFLCFKSALGQNVAFSTWEGFEEHHAPCSQRVMVCHGQYLLWQQQVVGPGWY